MRRYIIFRILAFIPMLLGISIISFSVMHLTPGSPVDAVKMNPDINIQAQERLYRAYGLDRPLHEQYLNWLARLIRFDFGVSFRDGRKVFDKIKERLPATLLLNLFSLALIFFISIPLGIISAVNRGGLSDRLIAIAVFGGYSIPSFALALISMHYLGLRLGWLPISGMVSTQYEFLGVFGKMTDILAHMIMPVITSSIGGLAFLSRYMRSAMLENISSGFILSARARGIKESHLILRHAFRNALVPLITILGLLLPALIGGSVIFETIFSWPGMGRLAYNAIMSRDYPVVMGVGIIMAVLTLIGNFLADIGYVFADPRVRYKR
jgi:peptide/nickel transport system permease protein